MAFINSLATWWMRKRMHQIELFMKYPFDVQDEWLMKLIASAQDTEWGKKHDYKNISNMEQFKKNVPLQDYDSLKPFIDRTRKGEQNILWNTDINYFAKSSGTTNDKSKFIPISEESLNDCHFNGGRDMIALYCTAYPESQLFTGKYLGLAGSLAIDKYGDYESQTGDLSAVVVNNLPKWMEFFSTPEKSIALQDKWEVKLKMIAEITANEDVVSLAGVPSWLLILMKQLLQTTNKNNVAEIWPNLEVYFHGGVNFTPYKEQFKTLINKPDLNFLELYNASEGFFGIQDQPDSPELLLMLDYGIYYEFMPIQQIGKSNPRTLSLSEVELNTNYVLIISTSGGLWRYVVGDTIKFTSLHPFRIQITGRTKNFMNAFGEEVTVDNADKALLVACEKSDALINEYSAAPVYISGDSNGAHEWVIEFEKQPTSIEYFTEMLDNALKAINSDYEAKRYHNMILQIPIVNAIPKGTFYKWLKSKNKLGGQYKVPRLSNDRKLVEEIYSILES
jgi:hypothetical protein